MTARRRAFTLFQLARHSPRSYGDPVRFVSAGYCQVALRRTTAVRAANNLKQLGLAMHNYHRCQRHPAASGNDANNFSAFAYTLPYIEQANVFNLIDFKKPMDDKANAAARKTVIMTYLNPAHEQHSIREHGLRRAKRITSVLCAGDKVFRPGRDNNGMFYQDSKVRFTGRFGRHQQYTDEWPGGTRSRVTAVSRP